MPGDRGRLVAVREHVGVLVVDGDVDVGDLVVVSRDQLDASDGGDLAEGLGVEPGIAGERCPSG